MIEKILLRVPANLKIQLREIAQRKGITLNQLILQILWEWVEKQQKESSD